MRADSFGHQFELERPGDVDKAFEELVRESYRVGLRERLGS